MRRPFDALIFDMDGTLVDTEPLHRRNWQRLLAELGIDVGDDEYHEHFAGRPGLAFCQERLGFPLAEAQRLTAEARRRFWDGAAGNVVPLPGVVAFLDRTTGWPRAVATSARRESALQMLAELGLTDAFQIVLTADDVRRGKPDPEIYRLAAQRLGVAPDRCLVFEDSPAGLGAARAAGMTCVGITTSWPSLPLAHLTVAGFDDERLPTLLAAGWPAPAVSPAPADPNEEVES